MNIGFIIHEIAAQGIMRPQQALSLDGDQQGESARIDAAYDGWGRLWLYFWTN